MLNPITLHLKVPRGNDKGPRAQEAVFSGLAEIFREHPATLSFEILVNNGFLYYVVVCAQNHIDLVRGQLFAHYPNIETEIVKDYAATLSSNAVVCELQLERPDVYPIKSYRELETDLLASLAGLATSVPKEALLSI
ncbi:hypothetical protein HY408_00450 [Candidatus Gottesmanbacteria bacterium]|nr:hypothetical protein [Candidatus Gottesmanbacteria bacterium]